LVHDITSDFRGDSEASVQGRDDGVESRQIFGEGHGYHWFRGINEDFGLWDGRINTRRSMSDTMNAIKNEGEDSDEDRLETSVDQFREMSTTEGQNGGNLGRVGQFGRKNLGNSGQSKKGFQKISEHILSDASRFTGVGVGLEQAGNRWQ